MRETSALWKSLREESGSFYEVRVTVGNTTYGHDKLKSVRISQSLTSGSGLSIGGTCSARCTLALLESTANWPRMAEFTVDVRVSNAARTSQSEWVTMGTFYTDEREADRNGTLTVVGYDAMLQTETSWSDKIPSADLPSSWPISASQAANLVSIATGIQIDSRTTLDNTVKFIGLDTTTTARDMLSYIAAGCGGNWQITPEGKLRLIGFAEEVEPPTVAGIAIAGLAVVGLDEWQRNGSTITAPDFVVIGLSARNITFGADLPAVTGVELTSEDGTVASAGSTSGYVVKGNCNFANTSGVASLCLSALSGRVYTPFDISGAILDPAAENGDLVIADGKIYQIGNIDWNLSNFITASLSAPFEEEVDHEYTMQSPEAKALYKAMKADGEVYDSLSSYIDMQVGNITLAVESIQAQVDNTVKLSATAYEFIKGEGQTDFSPASITITDTSERSATGTYVWKYGDTPISGQSGSSLTVPKSLLSSAGSVVVRCEFTTGGNTYKDEVSIVWIEGGQDGEPGKNGQTFAWNLIHNTMEPNVSTVAQRPNINGYNQQVAGKYGYLIPDPNSMTLSTATHGARATAVSAQIVKIKLGTSTFANAGLYGLVAGHTYTFSCDCKWKLMSGTTSNSDNYYMRIYLYTDGANPGSSFAQTDYKSFATITQAQRGTVMSERLEYKFLIPANATAMYLMIRCTRDNSGGYATGDYIELQNMMLQEGEDVSPWSPAYEDMVGENGAMIAAVEYGTSSDGDTEPSTWSISVPAVANGDWLWCRTTYTDGTEAFTKSYAGTNGTNGQNGAQGDPGTPGEDAYTIVADNDYIEIPVGTDYKPTASQTINCDFTVYKGITALTPTTATNPGAGTFKVQVTDNPNGVKYRDDGTACTGMTTANPTSSNKNRIKFTTNTSGTIDKPAYAQVVITIGASTAAARRQLIKIINISANMNDQVVMNRSRIDIQDNKIDLVVETVEDPDTGTEHNVVNVASIVLAINDDEGSEAWIKSDHIWMVGDVNFVTTNDLSTYDPQDPEATVINGSHIQTGEIDASVVNIKDLNASNITTGYLNVNDQLSLWNAMNVYSQYGWAGTIGTAPAASQFTPDGLSISSFKEAENYYDYGQGGYCVTTLNGARVAYDLTYANAYVSRSYLTVYYNAAEVIYESYANGNVDTRGYLQASGTATKLVFEKYQNGTVYSSHTLQVTETGCYADTTPLSGSDRRLKGNISYDLAKLQKLFDLLKPTTFVRTDHKDGKLHIGFIAQDVMEAIEKSGLTKEDLALVMPMPKEEDKEQMYGLGYDEFIALCVDQIQRLKAKNTELEDRLARLEARLDALEGK